MAGVEEPGYINSIYCASGKSKSLFVFQMKPHCNWTKVWYKYLSKSSEIFIQKFSTELSDTRINRKILCKFYTNVEVYVKSLLFLHL